MSSITCTKCGASIPAGARFCRRCGEPVPASAQARVLEAETRIFGTPNEPATPTQHINSPLTGPAYMAPEQMPVPPSVVTNSLKPSGSTAKVAVLASLVLILLIGLVSLAILTMLKNQESSRPVVTIPQPPQPPPPGGSGTSINNSLIYPGAETMMDLTKDGNRVLQLRTIDPLDKVVDWYTEKIRPTDTVKVPGGNVTVLRGDSIKAVITAEDTGGTQIILKQGADE